MSLTDQLLGQLASNLDACFGRNIPANLGVAVSGGSDSLALLHLACIWARANEVKLWAITVDHNLRENSADEAALVAKWCQELGVAHDTRVWHDWDRDGNLQDAARQARYKLINAWRGNLDYVLIGHTLDDQAETLLQRLKRGSGVDGMCGMQMMSTHETGMTLLRPLLDTKREELQAYLDNIGQSWIDDPSNENTAFDRIAMRKLLPHLQSAGIELARFSTLASHMQRAQGALNHYASDAAVRFCIQDGTDLVLDHGAFCDQHPETQLRVLSAALCWISGQSYRPRFDAIQRALRAVENGKVINLHGCLMYPNKNTTRITREYAAVVDQSDPHIWDGRWKLVHPSEGYILRALGEQGAEQLDQTQRAQVPYRSLFAQPAIFEGDQLFYTPTLDQTQRQFVQDLRINFIDYLSPH